MRISDWSSDVCSSDLTVSRCSSFLLHFWLVRLSLSDMQLQPGGWSQRGSWYLARSGYFWESESLWWWERPYSDPGCAARAKPPCVVLVIGERSPASAVWMRSPQSRGRPDERRCGVWGKRVWVRM